MRNEEQIKEKISLTVYSAGVDEAGAGPLCGDLVVAAVILDPNNPISGLNDSKKLSEKKRDALYPEIIEKALDYCIVYITPQEIDQMNIFQARMEGFRRAVAGLKRVDYAVLDGDKVPPRMLVETDCLVKGDAKVAAISAASILAKVSRDKQLIEIAKIYPHFGFERHKGYCTSYHLEMLKEHGSIPGLHRFSYRPVIENMKVK
jgi:ribonuclease HII